MSTFDPARPRYALPFAGKEYELLGTFGLIEAVEYAAKMHIGMAAVQIVNGMPAGELSKVISAILLSCDHKLSPQQVGELLWKEVGFKGDADKELRLHLYAFLSICLAPPSERQKKADEMGKMMGKDEAPAPSPGETTAASA